MNRVHIVGASMTDFKRQKRSSVLSLTQRAVMDCLRNSEISSREIQLSYFCNVLAKRHTDMFQVPGQICLESAGLRRSGVVNIENACASGSTGIHEAYMAIASGMYDIVLVVGVEKMTSGGRAPLKRTEGSYEALSGWNIVSEFGMRANRYCADFEVSPADFAWVTIKNRQHGSLNQKAQFQSPVSLGEVLDSPMISDPLTKLQCSSTSDGAAAVILASSNWLKRRSKKFPEILAVSMTSGTYQKRDITFNQLESEAAITISNRAGIDLTEIDLAEVHDCFTVAEVLRVESLGLVERGTYLQRLQKGEFHMGSNMVINPSGGLLSKGHPTGATGVAQIVECFEQLTGRSQSRQIPNPRLALAHCSGGSYKGDTASCVLTLVKG